MLLWFKKKNIMLLQSKLSYEKCYVVIITLENWSYLCFVDVNVNVSWQVSFKN